MKQVRKLICVLMAALLPGMSVIGSELPPGKVEAVRRGMTICGGGLGLAVGIFSAIDLIPADTPLSNSLLVAIPLTAITVTTGALAGRWIADRALAIRPSLLFSPVVGTGLGMLGAGLAGGVSFAIGMAIAVPAVGVSTGSLNYPQSIGMGFVAGAVWGGIAGIPVGAVMVPIISLYMGF
jgi:hypothetical protein